MNQCYHVSYIYLRIGLLFLRGIFIKVEYRDTRQTYNEALSNNAKWGIRRNIMKLKLKKLFIYSGISESNRQKYNSSKRSSSSIISN